MIFLKNKKGQVSVEMIAIVAVLILGAVILAALFLGFSRSQTDTASELDTSFSSTLENYLIDIGAGVDGEDVDDADYIQLYTLNLFTNPDSVGSVTGAGIYQLGDPVTIEADLPFGYVFLGWSTPSGQVLNPNLVYNFQMPATDLTLYANYSLDSYTLSVSKIGTGSGLVISDVGGINCGPFCSSVFIHGTSVVLSAIPFLYNNFIGWTGEGCSGTGPCLVTMDQTRLVTANFSTEDCTLNLIRNPTAGGSVLGSGIYNCGSSKTVTAIPNVGYDFVNWTHSSGEVVSLSPSYTFNLNNNTTLRANFVVRNCTLSAKNNPLEGGFISPTDNLIQQCGTPVTLRSNPFDGYNFSRWSSLSGGILSPNNPYTFILPNNMNIIANYNLDSYDLILLKDPVSGGEVFGSGTYNYNQEVHIKTTSNIGYNFLNWSDLSGNILSGDSEYTFNMPLNDLTLVANFEINHCDLILNSSPSSGGSVSGAGTYQCGSLRTVTASSNIGYEFLNWTNSSGEVVSTSQNYTFNLNTTTTLRANFVVKNCTLNLIANPTSGGSVSGSGAYQCGSLRTVTANPYVGYEFVSWTDSSGEVVSTSQNYTFNLNDNTTLRANFIIKNCTLTIENLPFSGGFVTPSSEITQQCGTSVSLTANPNVGYNFNSWTTSTGGHLSFNNPYIFILSNDRTIRANYNFEVYTLTLLPDPIIGGSVSGSGNYNYNDSVTVTANPNSDFIFNNWTDSSGSVVSSSPIYNFNMPSENKILKANYSYSSPPFMSLWDTRNTSIGSSNDNQIELPLVSSGTYNFIVDWGDGTESIITSWNDPSKRHTYTSPGVYTIKIEGLFEGFSFNNSGDKLKLLEISQWGGFKLGNVGNYFYGSENLEITATDILDLNRTTNLRNAFRGCEKLTTVPNMNNWDVSNITDMYGLFWNASSFNQDISSWNTDNVTRMTYIFRGASSFNQDIGSWNVSNVTSLLGAFQDASSFNQDISSWNISKVTSMSSIFRDASSFNQDISSWNVSNVISFLGVFQGASSFNQDISSWNVSNVTSMTNMFRDARSFNQDLSSWCVEKISLKPSGFDTNAYDWILPNSRPIWGTCP